MGGVGPLLFLPSKKQCYARSARIKRKTAAQAISCVPAVTLCKEQQDLHTDLLVAEKSHLICHCKLAIVLPGSRQLAGL